MANNRMYITCPQCPDDPFFLCSYFPTPGWYFRRVKDGEVSEVGFQEDLNHWLDKHNECVPYEPMFGPTHFKISYETENSEMKK